MTLTPKERATLQQLVDGKTLDYAGGGEWYLGNSRIDSRIVWSLIKKMLLRGLDDRRMKSYTINEAGRAAVSDTARKGTQ